MVTCWRVLIGVNRPVPSVLSGGLLWNLGPEAPVVDRGVPPTSKKARDEARVARASEEKRWELTSGIMAVKLRESEQFVPTTTFLP